MTLDEILTEATNLADVGRTSEVRSFARAVLDTLGEALPCGYETPEVSTVGGTAHVSAECFVGTPDDARAYAAAIIRAADEIDGGAK